MEKGFLLRASAAFLDALRAIQLCFMFLPALLLAPLALLSPKTFGVLFGRALTRGLESAGSTFIKLGQWAGTRPDILPEALCGALAKLHESVEAESMDVVLQSIEEGLERPVEA